MPFLIAVLDAQDPPNFISTIFLVVALVMLAFFLFVLLNFFFLLVRPWLRAFFAATPIPMFQIVAMRMRGSPVYKILDVGIAASQAGHRIAWEDLERASIQGADLNMITDAYCILRERGEHYSIEELVLAFKESRLQKMLD